MSTPDMSPANALTATTLENEVKNLKVQINSYETILAANLTKIEELKKVNEENQAGIEELGLVARALIDDSGAGDRDELRVTLDKLKQKFAELEAVAASGNTADGTLEAKTAELETALKERDGLKAELVAKNSDLETALKERDGLKGELGQKNDELETALKNRDGLKEELEAALKLRDSLKAELVQKNHEIGMLKAHADSTRPPSTDTERSGSSGPQYDSQSPRAKAARRMLNGETLESRNHPDINPKDVLACNKQKLMNKIKNAENDLANLQIELEKLDAAPQRREDLKRTRELEKEVNEADRKIKAAKKQAAETKAKADAVIAENERKLREAKDRKAEAARQRAGA